MEETISLQEIVSIIKKRITLIISLMFIGIGLAAIFTFMIVTPKYSSSAQMLATLPKPTEGVGSNVNDVNFNLYMITTYKDFIMKSNKIAEEAQAKLASETDFTGTADEVKGMITVTQEQNSQMFSIGAIATKPEIAQIIANTVAKSFQVEAKEVLDVDKVTIVSEGRLNPKPVSPNNKLNLLIGMVLGLMLGVGLAFLVELLDKTVKDSRFVAETVGFTILGTVPQMSPKELNAKIVQRRDLPVATPDTLSAATSEVGTQTRRDRSRV